MSPFNESGQLNCSVPVIFKSETMIISLFLGFLLSTLGLICASVLGVLYYLSESKRLKEIGKRYGILRKRRQDEVRKSFGKLKEQLKVSEFHIIFNLQIIFFFYGYGLEISADNHSNREIYI